MPPVYLHRNRRLRRFTLHPRPRVGPHGERIRPRFKRRRFTRRERAYRVYEKIYNAKGITIKQLARRERISVARTYYYIRLMRKLLRKQGVKIERLDKKFFYVSLAQKEEVARKPAAPIKGDVELRGYVNYASSEYKRRDIDIDCVIIVPKDERSIMAGAEAIKQMVVDHFNSKLAGLLKFGTSPATPQSQKHFRYRHHGGVWVEF